MNEQRPWKWSWTCTKELSSDFSPLHFPCKPVEQLASTGSLHSAEITEPLFLLPDLLGKSFCSYGELHIWWRHLTLASTRLRWDWILSTLSARGSFTSWCRADAAGVGQLSLALPFLVLFINLNRLIDRHCLERKVNKA